MLKSIIKKTIPKKYHKGIYDVFVKLFSDYSDKSYSQDGEDMVMKKFLCNVINGFYVDIGAYHPKRFSNTFYFYKKGWSGINIDARPDCMRLFKEQRPRDINLEFAISNKKEKLTYYAFNEPALNGFSAKLSLERNKNENYKIIFKKEIKTRTLTEILDKFLPKGQHIDFMSIDIEGLDLNALKSNNWKKYVPSFILVEILKDSIEEVLDDKIYNFILNKNYKAIAKTGNTVIFRKN